MQLDFLNDSFSLKKLRLLKMRGNRFFFRWKNVEDNSINDSRKLWEKKVRKTFFTRALSNKHEKMNNVQFDGFFSIS